MRQARAVMFCVLAGAAAGGAGCYDYLSDARAFLQDPGPDGDGGTGGGGGAGGGTTTTIDPGCIPNSTPNPVRDDCGVFVSRSKGDDDSGDGTKEAPFATIAKALASPQSGPVYLCAEVFAEAVQVKSGATIYGGLDCTADWIYSAAKKSEISPDAGMVPLVVDPLVGVVIEDVAFRAQDAAEPGGSSIAVIATTGAEVELTRCDVEAGNGKDGAVGEAFAMSAAAGGMGNSGNDACGAAIVVGGGSVTNACDEADPDDNSIGASGGNGEEGIGADGSKGSPGTTDNRGTGEDVTACTDGGPGDGGALGTSGTGAQGMGTLSAQGYAGPAGTPGDKGKPGQGGGGGGGAKGGALANQCAMAGMAGGASGGSGGSGGCGGAGGKGGQAGGASMGLLSFGATLLLTEVKVTSKSGGNGGAGGNGQLGGMGGTGGTGGSKGAASALKNGCSGGPGGSGGSGGKGGGGLGGPSIGIAHTGDAPDVTGATIVSGVAGNGGIGDGDTGQGAAGLTAKVQGF